MDNGRIRNILWDWNGTLLNDMDLCIDCMNILLKERSLPKLSHDFYKEVFTFPIRDYFLKIGFDFSKEAFELPADKFVVLYNQRYPEASLFDGAAEALEHFRNLGIRQFVLSAQEHELLGRLLEYFNIRHFFEAVTGTTDNYAHSKLEAGRRLIAGGNLEPAETIMIGDTIHDHEVATSLGIPCLLISHGHQSAGRLNSTGSPVMNGYGDISRHLEAHYSEAGR